MHKYFSYLFSDLSITTHHMFVLFCCNAKWVNLSLRAQCVYFMLQVASLSLLLMIIAMLATAAHLATDCEFSIVQ